jgi:uncharacterized membrane protein
MSSARKSIANDVGLLTAAVVIPGTLQKSMIERDAVDQGVATGLSMALAFSIAVLMQDGIEAITDQIIDEDTDTNSNATGVISSFAAIGIGLVAQKLLQQKDKEPIGRSIGRTLGYWLSVTGAAGVTLRSLNEVTGSSEQKSIVKESGIIFPLGVLLALLFDFVKYKKVVSIKDSPITSSPAKSIVAGIGLIAALTIVSRTEKVVARNVQKTVDTYAKPLSKGWLPIGHVVSSALLFGGLAYGMSKLYKKIESGQDAIESNFSEIPTSPFVSGSTTSYVAWSSLSLQGRRYIGTRISKEQLNRDLAIKRALDPIRIYIGVDSADTEQDRVALALAEIDRTHALDRDIVVLIAPTGTGYVNYVMSDTVEYLSKGNCAMIAMQYSKRPSPLSLDHVDEGFIQFRILVNALAKRLRSMPQNKRPTVVLFGESLGAWVSQDAFLHSGTDGLVANNIDRALWIGTPELSKWQEHVSGGDKLNVDEEIVGTFDNINEFRSLPSDRRKKLQYVMCTHYNDPVAHFSGSLLFRAPQWLRSYDNRPETLPQNTRYRTPTTFVHRIIDMKNALKPKPGVFTSIGHDYRADLLGFINEVYDFHYTDVELQKIDQLLTRNDKNRGNM